MYLSRVQLDLAKRKTLQAFYAPNLFHGAAEQCFEGKRQRNLWRIDHLNGQYYFLLLSDAMPNFESFCEQFGNGTNPETRNFQVLLDKIEKGDRWRFRLVANPTNSLPAEKGKRGKVVAHIGVNHQKEWLLHKSQSGGFSLEPEEFQVTESRWFSFRKKAKDARITLLSVTY